MTNPLLGANGATEIYGPQKGADAKMIPKLDSALTTYHDMIERELNVSVKDIPGAGVAGVIRCRYPRILQCVTF